jgi:hypothetical protein
MPSHSLSPCLSFYPSFSPAPFHLHVVEQLCCCVPRVMGNSCCMAMDRDAAGLRAGDAAGTLYPGRLGNVPELRNTLESNGVCLSALSLSIYLSVSLCLSVCLYVCLYVAIQPGGSNLCACHTLFCSLPLYVHMYVCVQLVGTACGVVKGTRPRRLWRHERKLRLVGPWSSMGRYLLTRCVQVEVDTLMCVCVE